MVEYRQMTVRGVDAYNRSTSEELTVPIYNWRERLYRRLKFSRVGRWLGLSPKFLRITNIETTPTAKYSFVYTDPTSPWFTEPPEMVVWSEPQDPEKW